MRVIRVFLFVSFCLLLSVFCLPPMALASAEFETAYDVRYQVSPTGITHVSQSISLTNKLSSVYATRYSLTLQGRQIENIVAADKEGPLKIETQQFDNQTKIDLAFNERVVGKDKTLTFNLSYDANDLANKIGQVWEVAVPKLADPSQIDNYFLTLAVPQSFGQPAFISPNPNERGQEEDSFLYRFTKNQLATSGVSAAFGQLQIFDFVFSYHLQNPQLTPAIIEIALPPDTAYQRVLYQKIEPRPLDVEIDPDGNWLASYKLGGGDKLNVTAVGKAKILAKPQENFLTPTPEALAQNLASSSYWQVDDHLIQVKAKTLKTPKQIYDFVVQTLSYDYSRVEEGAERLGALRALQTPQKAICMEFADLFIALARAAGIPAREINGYAHTNNPRLRPLSLVSDVLHSWPEYWNEEKQTWVPIDPTWEETTGGVDYFNKIDMNHFVFVIHGQDSETPYPAGSYKTEEGFSKDIQVVFGKYEDEITPQIEAEFELGEGMFFELDEKGKIIIKNKGPSSVYNLPLKIEAQGISLNSPAELIIVALPPFGQEEVPIQLSSSLFKFGQGNLTLSLNGQKFSQPIKLRSLALKKVLPFVILILLLTFIFVRVKSKIGLFLRNWRNKASLFLRNKAGLFLRNKLKR